jgi:hypothetical protein
MGRTFLYTHDQAPHIGEQHDFKGQILTVDNPFAIVDRTQFQTVTPTGVFKDPQTGGGSH